VPDSFHDAFEAALGGDSPALDAWLGVDAPSRAGLSVYRNTVAKGRVDALAGLYPTVVRLVGEAWFRDAALIFARAQRPVSPVLDDYGTEFPDWLEAFPPAQVMAFLAPVARLDRAWSQAHRAVDAPVLLPDAVSGVAAATLFAARATLHPSLQLFWFDWTVPTIWLANRPDVEPGQAISWEESPEGIMLLRPAMTVTHRRLTWPEWGFLDACRRGLTLGEAAAVVFRHEPSSDLSTLFAGLLTSGAFTRIEMEPAS
tara:strand:+ start:10552 stop:11322 length:771 start_codon:yes stop_codon:yes gene_type:complete